MSGNVTIAAGTVMNLKAIAFKSGVGDSAVTSGSFDNQNDGGNGPIPGQEEGKVEGGSVKAEVEPNEKQLAQSTASGQKEGTKLSRFQFNLWNSDFLRDDPNLNLSWWGKKKKQGTQGGTNQMTSGNRSVIYTLDLMGNRTNVSEDGANKSYLVNSLNQYSTGHGLAVRIYMKTIRIMITAAGVATLLWSSGLTGCKREPVERTSAEHVDDEKLTEQVKAAFENSPSFKFPDVHVASFKGTVQLSGFVLSDDQKQAAENLAKSVPGVVTVENKISRKP